MNSDALFGLSILMSFVAFGIITKLYIWPRLRVMRRGCAHSIAGSSHIPVRWAQLSNPRGRIPLAFIGVRGSGRVW